MTSDVSVSTSSILQTIIQDDFALRGNIVRFRTTSENIHIRPIRGWTVWPEACFQELYCIFWMPQKVRSEVNTTCIMSLRVCGMGLGKQMKEKNGIRVLASVWRLQFWLFSIFSLLTLYHTVAKAQIIRAPRWHGCLGFHISLLGDRDSDVAPATRFWSSHNRP